MPFAILWPVLYLPGSLNTKVGTSASTFEANNVCTLCIGPTYSAYLALCKTALSITINNINIELNYYSVAIIHT